MADGTEEFNRLLFPTPDEFPPLSALVYAELGARSRRREGEGENSDHYLVMKLGRSQETMLTSLPENLIASRFEEHAYAMVLADGMGRLGEVASGLSVAAMLRLALNFGRWNLRVDELLAPDIIDRITRFYRQIDHALISVNRLSTAAPLYATLTSAVSGGRDLFVAHVGHSRAYLWRDGELTQLTNDHTKARPRGTRHLVDISDVASDLHHVLTDALGAGTVDPRIEVGRLTLVDRDAILVCTNGLTDVLGDSEIAEVLEAGGPVQEVCDALTARAVLARCEDDVTVLLGRYHVPQ